MENENIRNYETENDIINAEEETTEESKPFTLDEMLLEPVRVANAPLLCLIKSCTICTKKTIVKGKSEYDKDYLQISKYYKVYYNIIDTENSLISKTYTTIASTEQMHYIKDYAKQNVIVFTFDSQPARFFDEKSQKEINYTQYNLLMAQEPSKQDVKDVSIVLKNINKQ